jgi:hypothetical protein
MANPDTKRFGKEIIPQAVGKKDIKLPIRYWTDMEIFFLKLISV